MKTRDVQFLNAIPVTGVCTGVVTSMCIQGCGPSYSSYGAWHPEIPSKKPMP